MEGRNERTTLRSNSRDNLIQGFRYKDDGRTKRVNLRQPRGGYLQKTTILSDGKKTKDKRWSPEGQLTSDTIELYSCYGDQHVMWVVCKIFASPPLKVNLFCQNVFAQFCQIVNMFLLRNAANIFMWNLFLNMFLRIIFWKKENAFTQKNK